MSTTSIFASAKPKSSWMGQRRNDVTPPARPASANDPIADDKIVEIILAPADPRETAQQAFLRKELALSELFRSLCPDTSRALRRRLLGRDRSDHVVAVFSRLIVERQQRLIGILSDAPRRHAIETARSVK